MKKLDKERVLSLTNALRTLKEISLKQNDLILRYLYTEIGIKQKKVEHHENRFKKITKDINFLMEESLDKIKFSEYLINSDKENKKILSENKEIIKLMELRGNEFELENKDLKEKLIEFDYILKEIEDHLEE
ncbi:hypothetical protein LCGC14_1251580 [marine sediment metagenome]|uniref:Uncharacterized protein n=1 Tax=marine sediment metagenome TaxID=412755 RepID=A0A0F9L6G7_9ZZZZ